MRRIDLNIIMQLLNVIQLKQQIKFINKLMDKNLN